MEKRRYFNDIRGIFCYLLTIPTGPEEAASAAPLLALQIG